MMQRKLDWKLSFCKERQNRKDSSICFLLSRSPARISFFDPTVDWFFEDLAGWKRGCLLALGQEQV